MFWSDPNLYGASFMYKDFPVQTPFAGQFVHPWQAFNRILPNYYGYMPTFFDVQKMGVPYMQQQLPYMQQQLPYVQQQFPYIQQQLPYIQQQLPYIQQQLPYFQGLNVQNLPVYNWHRPFIC